PPEEPDRFEPPWIHTITGRFPVSEAVLTSSVRQSSLAWSQLARFQPSVFCRQAGPFCVASLTPCHGRTACGARQRKSPSGGAAYGIARNTSALSVAFP